MLTERRAELMALEHRIEGRLRRVQVMFWVVVIISNIITGVLAVTVALHMAHEVWKLHP
jgi:hypothetical protein